METAYQPAAWHDLYLMVGTVAGGLTGLIFVAVSLHFREVLRDPWHRGTAGTSLLALMSVVLISGALLIPEQPLPLLGAEIVIIALASPAYSARALAHLPSGRRLVAAVEIATGMAGSILAIAAGLSLAAHAGGGLWLLLPGAAIALGSFVFNRVAPDGGRCRGGRQATRLRGQPQRSPPWPPGSVRAAPGGGIGSPGGSDRRN